MTTTTTMTQVGTTLDLLDATTVAASVSEALAGWEDDFDVEVIVEYYRARISAVAPGGFYLVGDAVVVAAGMDTDEIEAGMVAWRDSIGEIDFWGIAAEHDNVDGV